ncbi:hypothetical protein CXB77_08620 [Chromatium okenii]|uniref:Uncharacterized protein n=1 Tax=Chromatium okenii TaxID=61644 RepID=A0A2S7XR33_9GAMM|nr:hypothetical protein CXB77_08620 [Chromatium okenii]
MTFHQPFAFNFRFALIVIIAPLFLFMETAAFFWRDLCFSKVNTAFVRKHTSKVLNHLHDQNIIRC